MLCDLHFDGAKLSVKIFLFWRIRQRVIIARVVHYLVECGKQIVGALDHESTRGVGQPFQLIASAQVPYGFNLVEFCLAAVLADVRTRGARGGHL